MYNETEILKFKTESQARSGISGVSIIHSKIAAASFSQAII